MPTTCIDFLGITIDTIEKEFRLPLEKVNKLTNLLVSCIRKKKVLLKELQSMLGLLAFATCILPMGRIFSLRLYLAIWGYKNPYSHIRLTTDLKEDMLVWLKFLNHFNGRAFWQVVSYWIGIFVCLPTQQALLALRQSGVIIGARIPGR